MHFSFDKNILCISFLHCMFLSKLSMNFYFYSWTLALMISGIVIPGGKLQEEIGKEIEVESDFLLFQNKAEEICWFEIGRWESVNCWKKGPQRWCHQDSGVLVWIMAAPLPVQLLAGVLGRVVEDDPSVWVPALRCGTWKKLLTSSFRPAHLAIAVIWRMNQQMENILSRSLLPSVAVAGIIVSGFTPVLALYSFFIVFFVYLFCKVVLCREGEIDEE